MNALADRFEFSNNIGENKERLQSFNELATATFGISFEHVGGIYEPHVILDGDVVCANISVNQMTFLLDGKRMNCIQLGTVMTKKEYRGMGLSRYLMEGILEEWKDKCDMIYLFGNDSVLEFYPKFGFVSEDEYEWKMAEVRHSDVTIEQLDMSLTESKELLWRLYKSGNEYSRFSMIENEFIMEFYCMGFMKENIYYIKEYDAIVIAEYEEDTLLCYEILGGNNTSLDEIMAAMAGKETKRIELGFTPKDIDSCMSKLHKEEDTTLFVYHGAGELLSKENKLIFPLISHA